MTRPTTAAHGRVRVLAACVLLLAGMALLGPAASRADGTWSNVRTSIGVGATLIDEYGDRSAFRERADQYEGLSLRSLGFHALAPRGLRIDLDAPRIDPTAHDARLEIGSRMLTGSVRTARNHFIYDPAGDLRSQRDQLTADLKLRPVRHLELFGEYARHDLSGRRRVLEASEDGALGPSYDQDTETWRGGVRLDGLRSNASVSYLGRTLTSRSAPDFDRGVHGVEAHLRSRPLPVMSAEGVYGWSRTTLSRDGTKLETDRVSGRLDFEMGGGFTAGPTGRFEESSDLALRVRSQIWALGMGVRGTFRRGWCDVEGEGGQRESSTGLSKVRGLRAAGAYTVAGGLSAQGLYERRARHRRDIYPPSPSQPVFATPIGTLMAQRVEGRLRWREAGRWSAEGLVARLDKDYDDVRVEQQGWRYGLQGSLHAGSGVRCDAGWRLDDIGETRPESRYDLRTNLLFGGVDISTWPRLALRARADYYRMQRDLDEWKLLVTAGAELEVVHDLFLGLSYERDRFDESFDAGDYRANVWQCTLRHTFGL